MSTFEQELEEQERRSKEMQIPSVKLGEGSNFMEMTSNEIGTQESKYPGRPRQKILKVVQDAVAKKLWLSETNPVYTQILKLAKENGKLAGLKIDIVRHGMKQGDTRMTVKRL